MLIRAQIKQRHLRFHVAGQIWGCLAGSVFALCMCRTYDLKPANNYVTSHFHHLFLALQTADYQQMHLRDNGGIQGHKVAVEDPAKLSITYNVGNYRY